MEDEDDDDAAALEKELLAVAGRTDRSRHHPPGSRRSTSSSSDGYSDEIAGDARLYDVQNTPSAPANDESDISDDHNPSAGVCADDAASDISYGSDLYRDDDDRNYLASLPELHRERILADRADRLESHRERSRLMSMRRSRDSNGRILLSSPSPAFAAPSSSSSAKDNHKTGRRRRCNDIAAATALPSSSAGRSRVLPGRKEKAEILSSLVALKQSKDKEKDRDSLRKRRKIDDRGREQTSDEEEDDDEKGTEESYGLSSEDVATMVHKIRNVAEEKPMGDGGSIEDRLDLAEFEDVVKITVPRSKLTKWLSEPYFDDTIAGCFVRLGVGTASSSTGYRLCQVKSVESGDVSRSYQVGNRMTHKYLVCDYGDKTLNYSMACVSEKPPTIEEFWAWFKEHHLHSGHGASQPLTKGETEEKLASINRALVTFVYSADTVKRMLEEKKKMGGVRPLNLAAEKDRVARELAMAETEGGAASAGAIARLKGQMKMLEEMAEKRRAKDAKAMALAEMNRRNREENFRAASERRRRRVLKPGQEGYDPFSRRWTQSHNYYIYSPAALLLNGGDSKNKDGGSGAGKESSGEAAPPAKGGGRNGSGASKNPAEIHGDVRLPPIDLARMHKYGRGAAAAAHAFMENRQRLERNYNHYYGLVTHHHQHTTTITDINNNNNIRNTNCNIIQQQHAQPLTINDYKRRMNLL